MTKVLILDHSKSMRKTLGERLAYEGYAIEATDDVSEASEMCRQMAFDVVLTDDSSNASPLGIPFIVLAGAGDNQIQRAVTAFRDGAMDFLQIPSDINRLYDTLLFYSKTKQYYFKPQKEKSYNRGFKPYHFKGVEEFCDDTGWYTLVNMKDVWNIDMVGRTSAERTGYRTFLFGA